LETMAGIIKPFTAIEQHVLDTSAGKQLS
jgi:hypothetical protein